MLSQSQLLEIRKRMDPNQTPSIEAVQEDRDLLYSEVERLTKFVKNFSDGVNRKLDDLEANMVRLDEENERLRTMCRSSNLERDACVGLLAKMAKTLGLSVGVGKHEWAELDSTGQQKTFSQNRVVIELPSGQVSWDYLESESHLFDELPQYSGNMEIQSIQDTYLKVMNPNLEVISSR
jgi:hypothetical protein